MLFPYPIDATRENWLHDCLLEMLEVIHDRYNVNQEPPIWPQIIPLDFRDILSPYTGLRDRINTYATVLSRLSSKNRSRIFQALNDQNNISSLLSCRSDCEAVTVLPKTIQKPILELFKFAFEMLSRVRIPNGLSIRDYHYKTIYESLKNEMCPFCGYEPFDGPGAPRHDLDHYLLESKYPFAAANLRNLVPMGSRCNSKYKWAQDILLHEGIRQRSYDPYNHVNVGVSLENSRVFEHEGSFQLEWVITFDPEGEESETWDRVFHIRERYKRDILDRRYQRWLEHFGAICAEYHVPTETDIELMNALQRHIRALEFDEIGDRTFLQAAVFRMLYSFCQHNDQRVINFLKSVVEQVGLTY